MRRTIAMTAACVVTLATAGVAAVVTGTPAQAAASTPGSARAVRATAVTAHGLQLSWTNPGTRNFARTEVRLAKGTLAPRNVHEGRRVAFVPTSRHTLAVGGLSGGSTYSFSVFAMDAKSQRAKPGTVRTVTVLDAPTSPRAYDNGASTLVGWRNPASPALRRVVVRYARGAAAPTRPTAGTGARLAKATAAQAELTGLAPESGYSVSIFAIDAAGRASAPAVVRFTSTPKDAVTAPEPGTYTGKVVDTDGSPLVGADIFGYPDTDDDDVDPVTARSGVDGTFTLSLVPGDWTIAAAGPDAVGGNADRTGYTYAFDDTTAAPGGSVTGSPLVLAPGALITGRITDTAGHPVEGATPYLGYLQPYVEASSNFFGFSYVDDTGPVTTGADGTWTLRGVDPGQPFQLCASARGATVAGATGPTDYLNRCAKRSTVLAAGTTTALPDLALARAVSGSVAGHIRGTDRHPITGTVYLAPTRNNTQGRGGYADSDADGSYRIDGVAPGDYTVCGSPGPVTGGARSGYVSGCSTRAITVRAGATTSGYAVLPVGAAVGGRVAGPDGKNLAGVEVSLETTTDDVGDDGGDDGDSGDFDDYDGVVVGGSIFGTTVTTDAQGRWSALGLSAGDYSVCYDNGESTGTPTGVLSTCWRRGELVSLDTGRLRIGVDQKLAAAGAISGTVTGASGAPVPYVSVGTGDAGDDEFDDDGVYTQSDRLGRYTLRGLTAGAHQVCYDTSDFDTNGVQGCLATKPTVRLGRVTTGANLRLPAPTAIAVHVVDTTGTAVAAVDAVALTPCTSDDEDDCDTSPLLGDDIGIDTAASRLTDGAGTTLLDGLEAGKHAVCLFAYYGTTVSGGSPTGYADACHGGRTFDVTVTRGHTTTVEMVLQPGGSVSGTVTDPNGRPLAGARLVVDGSAADDYTGSSDDFTDDDGLDRDGESDYPGASPGTGSRTAADGTYSVIGVRPGASTVCAVPTAAAGGTNGYLAQCLGAAPGTDAGATPVTVTAGKDTGGVDLRITRGAVLSGHLTAAGKPFTAAAVLVFPGRSSDEFYYTQAETDGSWSVGSLPGGSYTVCAVGKNVGGLCWHFVNWNDEDEDPPLARAVLIPVAAGATRGGIAFALSRR